MSIKIVTDSASDLLPHEAEGLGVTMIPLTLNWDGNEYRDAVDMDHKVFFHRLETSDSLPKTSQVSPAAFTDVFEELLKDCDELIVITISSKLSGTCQSAVIAADSFEGRVHVVDSLSATVGERLLIQKAISYCAEGLTSTEIVERLGQDRKRIRVIARLDTLKYLKKGGRIPPAVAIAGEALSVKPVITIEDGLIAVMGKARGSKNANNLLRKMVSDCGGIDFSAPCCLVHSGISGEQLKQYIDDSTDIWKDKLSMLPIATIGAVIGTHIGPGAIGVAFFENKANE